MKSLQKIESGSILLLILFFVATGCVKKDFSEPPDPFIEQRLEEGYLAFEFASAVDTITILTNAENVNYTDKGNVRIRGTIFADRDTLPPVRLSQGDFILINHLTHNQETISFGNHQDLPVSKGSFRMLKSGAPTERFEGFGGYSQFTLPQVGITQGMEIPTVDGSPIGFAPGSELMDFPVNRNRNYFYFHYPDEASFFLEQSSFMIDKLALDPDDPYFFVHASAMEIPGLDMVEEGGFAVSVEGMIPFTVPSSLSFGKVESFDYGNVMVQATINLESVLKIPLLIKDATCTIGFGNLEDGVNFFNGSNVPMMMGLRGSFVLNIADIVEWEVGAAALSIRVGGYDDFEFRYAGYYDNSLSIVEMIEDLSGVKANSTAFKFLQLPQTVTKVKTYGTFGTEPDNWEVGLKSESYFEFPHIITVDLGGIDFEINPDRLYFNGRMPVALFGKVQLKGEIKNSGAFRFQGSASAGVSYSKWGLSIDLGFKAGFDLKVDAIDDWYFGVSGKVYLDISIGEPWLEAHDLTGFEQLKSDPRLKASVSFSARLNSKGKFKGTIKFSFAKIGYSLHFEFSMKGEDPVLLDLQEIPIEEVPMENQIIIPSSK